MWKEEQERISKAPTHVDHTDKYHGQIGTRAKTNESERGRTALTKAAMMETKLRLIVLQPA